IQIVTVLCVLLAVAVDDSAASTEVKAFAFVVLVLVAVLEFFAYHGIYKPLIKAGSADARNNDVTKQ
ncbi:MAG: hypothetical protein ACR2RL_19780, partial [Gammaproteobacteria bacterium]